MSKGNKETALSKVQTLYLMQVELWNFLDEQSADADLVKSAKRTLKEFQELLDEVDWQYMGGEDVFETLQWIPGEVKKKLKDAKPAKAAPKRSTPKKAVTKKAVAKKPAAKKTPAKKKK